MWQVLIVLYFIAGAASYLIRRVLAQKLGEHNRLIVAVFFFFFLLPATIILSFFFPHNLNVGKVNLLFLLGGSIIWPISNITAFYANKTVDVAISTIINNLSPIFTLAIALPLLNEHLRRLQLVGAGLLILSGLLAAASQFKRESRTSLDGMLACLLTTVVLGVAVAYERFMLSRVDFGAYIVYGWGAQIVWALILAHKQLKKLPQLFNQAGRLRNMLIFWGLASLIKSITFLSALKISTASIISSASNFLSVVVVIAAYFYLHEREHIAYRIMAVFIGVAGLLFIAV